MQTMPGPSRSPLSLPSHFLLPAFVRASIVFLVEIRDRRFFSFEPHRAITPS